MIGRRCPSCQAQYYRECWTNFVQENGERWWHPKGPHGYKCMECGYYWPRVRPVVTFNHYWSALFAALRAALAIRYLFFPSWSAWTFGICELSTVSFTLLGLRSRTDASGLGRLVPVLYLAPLLLQPSPTAGWTPAGYILGALVGLHIFVRLYMGKQITIGVPKFGKLLDRGPYAYIRHPLATLELLIVAAFAIRFASIWNLAAWLIASVSIRKTMLIEERFLRTLDISGYDEYASRVPDRSIPWKAFKRWLYRP
jgi:protein-S-isoprenylcysteine O-methyltransferase Ste14